MTTFFNRDEILRAAQIPTDHPGADHFVYAIWNYGLIEKRAFELAAESFKLEAIRQLTNPERAAMHKGIGFTKPEPAPKPKIAWRVTNQLTGLIPTSRYVIKATELVPNSDGGVGGAWSAYEGHPIHAHAFTFLGQHPPKEIIEEYARRCGVEL